MTIPTNYKLYTPATIFTALRYARAVCAMGPCLSVSVTSRSSNKTAQRVSYRIAPIPKTLSDLECHFGCLKPV